MRDGLSVKKTDKKYDDGHCRESRHPYCPTPKKERKLALVAYKVTAFNEGHTKAIPATLNKLNTTV